MPRPNRGAYLDWREDRQCWCIVWYERGRRRTKSTGTGSRDEAEKALGRFLLQEEPVGPRDPTQRKVADVLTLYAEERGAVVTDAERLAYAIQALVPWWGARTVSDIREGTCRAYARERGVAPGTVRRELTVAARRCELRL